MDALRRRLSNDGRKIISQNQPLRRPRHSTAAVQSQYIEMKDEWRQRRELVLSVSRATYMSKGKLVVRELQSALQDADNATKIIFLLYERAMKDLYSFPIAALLFEDLGCQNDAAFDCEKNIDILQGALQNGLSTLNSKLARLEVLEGTDVGVIFLLYSLLKLENIRGSDGAVFKGLLMKLFKTFYPYALGASKNTREGLNDSAVSALCLILQVANDEMKTDKDKQKLEQLLIFLRNCYFHGSLKGIGKIQIMFTLENVCANDMKRDVSKYEFYAEKYATLCKRKQYILDSIDFALSGQKSDKTSNCDKGKEDYENDAVSDKSDVFLDSKDASKVSSESSEVEKGSAELVHSLGYDGNQNQLSKEESIPKEDVTCRTKGELRSSVTPKDEDQALEQEGVRKSISSSMLQNFIENGTINENKETEEKVTEYIKVPEGCAQRIIGDQEAILRKLEFKSNAIIEVNDSLMGEELRPETTSLTAHRLVAGALGVSAHVDEDKLKAEKEKITNAKAIAARYRMAGRQLEVKITGSLDAVSSAKQLINGIVNFTTFMAVPLPGFTLDRVIDSAGEKLKTIETLLNVIFRLEELEDDSVILHISGDKKSCEDARTLIIENLGNLNFSHGLLIRMPVSLAPILKSKDEITSFVRKLMELGELHILLLESENKLFFFLRGNAQKVYKAQNVLNKLNIELVFFDSTNRVKDVTDLFRLMDAIYHGERPLIRHQSQEPNSPVEKRKIYSRTFLMQSARLPASNELPLALKDIADGDDEVCKAIIATQSNYSAGKFAVDGNETFPKISSANEREL